MIETSRRGLLLRLGAALITAPAIVRAGSLMPVKLMVSDGVALTSIEHPFAPLDRHLGDVILNPDGSVEGIWNGLKVFTHEDAEKYVEMVIDSDRLRSNPRGLRILSR